MSLAQSKLVPAAFWVGFLALGFVTSVGGPDKRRSEHVAQPTKAALASQALAAREARALTASAAARD